MQSAYVRPAALGIGPTDDNKLSRLRHFDLTQIPRSPGAYGWSSRFEMAPSRPSLHASTRKAGTIADDVVAEEQPSTFFLINLCSRFLRSISGSATAR